MVFDHERDYPSRWAAVAWISGKVGCSACTLHGWVKKAEVNSGKHAGVPTEVAEKVKALKRQVRELRQANEILRQASAYVHEIVGGEVGHSPAPPAKRSAVLLAVS